MKRRDLFKIFAGGIGAAALAKETIQLKEGIKSQSPVIPELKISRNTFCSFNPNMKVTWSESVIPSNFGFGKTSSRGIK